MSKPGHNFALKKKLILVANFLSNSKSTYLVRNLCWNKFQKVDQFWWVKIGTILQHVPIKYDFTHQISHIKLSKDKIENCFSV